LLIQVRVGPEKWRIKQLIYSIRSNCGLNTAKVIPHISLYGDFRTSYTEVPRVISTIRNVANKYDSLPFYIDGYDFFKGEHGYVCALKINPSGELRDFRLELSERLSRIAPSSKQWDIENDFKFHITIAHRLSQYRYDKIRRYLEGNPSLWQRILLFISGSANHTSRHPYLPMDGIRVTLLNDNRTIRCEYDFMQKRMLDRTYALNGDVTANTLRILRDRKGIQQNIPIYKSEPSTFIFGDTHFGHANIIRYCGRPFSCVDEMDAILKNNWNNKISGKDKVYFLGDMSHDRLGASYWINKLNGDITFIQGNHDSHGIGVPYQTISYEGHNFLLVHSPDSIPIDWDGWIIHGHKHNNDVYQYPFINGEKKTINVGAELVNYQPVDMNKLLSLDIESIKRMDTIGSIPERW